MSILDACRFGPGRSRTLRGWSAIKWGIGRSGPDVGRLTLSYAGFLEHCGLALVRVYKDSELRRASGSKSSGYLSSPTRITPSRESTELREMLRLNRSLFALSKDVLKQVCSMDISIQYIYVQRFG